MMRDKKCFEWAELSAVSIDRECLVGRRDLCDSGAAADGFRSGFRLGSNPFSRCGHERAFTYNYVKSHLKHAALHDLSATQSEAARSECVVLSELALHDLLSSGSNKVWYATSLPDMEALCRTDQQFSYDACSVKYGFWKRSATKTDISPIPRCEANPREGRRRNPTNWTYTTVPTPSNTRHGYTGHEHLDKFALINMNGRVYDPITGRFLSPDPVLQDPANAQNYNSYSYVLNNPLKFTDPSGYVYYGNYVTQTAPDMMKMNRMLQYESLQGWLEMKAQNGEGLGQTGNLMLMMLGFAGTDLFGGGGGGDMFGTNTTTSTPTCEDANEDGNNPGEVYLVFNGSTLSCYYNGKCIASVPAVSGHANSDGEFDYSICNQATTGGPIPEGTYYVNISGYEECSLFDALIGVFGFGHFPGGSVSWGDGKNRIYPNSLDIYNPCTGGTVSRSGWYLHGGLIPGSSGCIDLGPRMGLVASAMANVTWQGKIFIYVNY